MAILQGTPVNTSGIHPFVAIMANGQASIDQSIARAGQGMAQANATSAQYIRDGIQGVIDQQKLKLQKDAQAAQERYQEAQLSLQERQMAERSRQFDATLASRAGDEEFKKAYQSRQLSMMDSKMRLQERQAAFQEKALSMAFGGGGDPFIGGPAGPMPMDGTVLPPLAEEPSFDLTSVVSDQDVEGNPLATPEYGINGYPPSLQGQLGAPAQAPGQVPQNAYEQAVDKQIMGLKLAAAMNPSGAGYAIQKIGELEAKRAQAAIVAAQGGPSGQVADIVNQHVVPFSGIVKGAPSPASVQKAWEEASPATKAALQAPDAEWDSLLKNGSLNTDQGAIPVDRGQLYRVRDVLNSELAARDKGTAEARFLATQQFKESGDQFVSELVKSNPYWSKLEKRRDQIEDIINADMKRVGEMPSREAIATLASSANSVEADKRHMAEMERLIQQQWETSKYKDKDGKDQYKRGVSVFPRIKGSEMDVGGWQIAAVDPNDPKGKKDADPRAVAFNSKLKEYAALKRKLELKENNLRSSLDIMDRKGFEVDVNSIRRQAFGEPEQPESEVIEDAPVSEGIAPGKRIVPNVMDDYLGN